MIASRQARLRAGLVFLYFGMLLLSGCGLMLPHTSALKANPPKGVAYYAELKQTPFFAQEDYQCGPAALAMLLNASGVKVHPDALVDQVYIPDRRGSLQIEMLTSARRNGLVAYELSTQMEHVIREINGGLPVIVLQNFGFRSVPAWHYAVVVGYDLGRSEFILRSGRKERITMPFHTFEYLWKDADYWSMVVAPPGRIPVTATEQGYAKAVAGLERVGKALEARNAYARMLERWPNSLLALIGTGNASYALKQMEESEAALQQAVRAHPKNAAARNNLASVLAERGKLKEALLHAERVVELGGPHQSISEATLDDILTRLGKPIPARVNAPEKKVNAPSMGSESAAAIRQEK